MRIKHKYASIPTPIDADFQSQPNGSNFTGNEQKLTTIFYKYSKFTGIKFAAFGFSGKISDY